MTFWNSDKWKTEQKNAADDEKLIDPYNEKHVEETAYELTLGPEVYISGANEKTILPLGGMVAIAPGQIAVLLTEERLNVPLDVLGFISLKSRVKIPGLINVSGFHVNPGFKGRLVFTVYNAGTETCAFTRGQKMFLLWFAKLSGPEEKGHEGSRQGQDHIIGNDITRLTSEVASPAKLNERLQKMEHLAKIYGALLLAIFLMTATMFIRVAISNTNGSPSTGNEMQQSSPEGTENGQHKSDEEVTITSNDTKPPSSMSTEK